MINWVKIPSSRQKLFFLAGIARSFQQCPQLPSFLLPKITGLFVADNSTSRIVTVTVEFPPQNSKNSFSKNKLQKV